MLSLCHPSPCPEPVPPKALGSVARWRSEGQQPHDCRLEQMMGRMLMMFRDVYDQVSHVVQNGLQFHCNLLKHLETLVAGNKHGHWFLWSRKSCPISHLPGPASGTPCGGGLKASSNIWCSFAFMDRKWNNIAITQSMYQLLYKKWLLITEYTLVELSNIIYQYRCSMTAVGIRVING